MHHHMAHMELVFDSPLLSLLILNTYLSPKNKKIYVCTYIKI